MKRKQKDGERNKEWKENKRVWWEKKNESYKVESR
jgi:hypothetical protein